MSKEESKTDKAEYLVHFKKWEWLIFITLILLIVSSPYLFTRNSWLGVSFNDTGEIGDTIGGLTAPFVNLFAAFLVYKSFSAQISANFIQQKNHREQLVAQQENHHEQISILLNEQSRNLLLSLYDRVQEDYEKRENEHSSNGWARQLNHGLHKLSKYSQKEFDDLPDRQAFLDSGNNDVLNSITEVNYIYTNLLMILNLISESLDRSDDDNIKVIAKYVCSKVSKIFNENGYSRILEFDIGDIKKKTKISESTSHYLKIAYQNAQEVRNSIDDTFIKLTEKIPNNIALI